jgi:predicted choloylglycine hydrolase
MALELQFHFCTNFNTNSYVNLSKNGSGAPGPFLYQFQYKFICKSIQKRLWSFRSISVPISIQIHMQIYTKKAMELQVHFCTKFNTNSYVNLYKNGSGAPGPFLYQFQFKFICKSIQKWLWSSRSISVPISIQIHMQIYTKKALELQVHFCTNFNTHLYVKLYKKGSGAPRPFFCTNFNTNSYVNLYKKSSGAPGPFLFQFQYKFICKSIQKRLWSFRSFSVPNSIQIHM